MGGGKLVPEKSWWGKKLVHLEEYIPVILTVTSFPESTFLVLKNLSNIQTPPGHPAGT